MFHGEEIQRGSSARSAVPLQSRGIGMKSLMLLLIFPLVAEAQMEPAASVVVSGPSGPLWQFGAGIRNNSWSYEARYGVGVAVGPNDGVAHLQSVAIYASEDVSNVFYWMVGFIHAHTWGTDGYYWGSDAYVHPRPFDRTYDSPAIGLGVGYKYAYVELQGYYPGVLLGIRVGIN